MKKIASVLLILLISASFLFADQKQIIVARNYACEDSCKMGLDSCNRGCRFLSGDLIVKSCMNNCIEDYGHCMQKCN